MTSTTVGPPAAGPQGTVGERPAAGSGRSGSVRGTPRMPRLPQLVSRLCFLAAVVVVLGTAFPGVGWIEALVDLCSTVFFPVDGASIGFAVFLLLLGAALARRKHVAWVLALVIFGFFLLTDLAVVTGLVASLFAVQTDFGSLPVYARFALNLAALGALTAAMVHYRGEFSARRAPGSVRKALLVLLGGLVVTVGVGMALVTVFPTELVGPRGRLAFIANRLVRTLFGTETDLAPQAVASAPGWIGTVVGLLLGLTLLAAVVALTRSQQLAALMSEEDEPRVRALVARSGDDSLAYFATRRDKSVVFAPDGAAAVTYRNDLGVCLASSDPIGPPERWGGAIRAWQALADTYGWTPAVVGASEAGATAYARDLGLRVIRIGDEAVLHPRDFHLADRDMRPVRQAVQRLERLGYTTRIRRHRDIPPAELEALVGRADAWRDTESERGFSMALGRLGDPADAACLMVEALLPVDRAGVDGGAASQVAGLLSFVPWGTDGFSLDVMRRNPDADNGVTELMVSALMDAGPELGVRRVSLNFAVFRSAFEEGARIGAGPVLRLWRRLLLVASRWWQFESLYRSNVKYRPEWQPRFLCFAETRDIALVGTALGVAEGFIDLPSFLRPRVELGAARHVPADGTLAVEPLVAPVADPEPAGSRLPEQVRLRMATRERLVAEGTDPYPPSFHPQDTADSVSQAGDADLGRPVSVAGRVVAVRDLGGVTFVVLRDWSGDVQLLLSADVAGEEALERLRRDVDLGDHLGAEGTVVRSRSGELSVGVTTWLLTAKSLRPPPDVRGGVRDPEARVRQRYLDLAVNPLARRRLRSRSAVLRAVRDTLDARGFLEVETPILQTIHGGANARPFRTHINAYDLDLYLRIAPELFLKRLMVGGVDRVFEIGRNFRNEGADATHNPEFTMLEAYEAYGDYTTMRTVAQQIVVNASRAVSGGTLVRGTDASGVEHEVDLADDWPVVTVNDAISAAAGTTVTADTPKEELLALARALGIAVDGSWTRGNVLLELYEHLVESRTVRPTFYTDFPAEVSPLTRQHRVDPRLAERWDLVAFGAEIGTAYSELVDPVEQRARLTAQSLQAAGGNPEAMELDEDFLLALEHAMPPSGGLGMGMDRLVMMLTQASIRETIAFPLVKPRSSDAAR
ncbi:lysyl-tRNA synthetase, class II [Microlunatus sagamiharensis]|uniref:Lysine--tRNA ligase n=2 Tax=Microlunatus sagamiharensis TaxID=546874 RepID=A0A1H2LQA9_9ACTN|nr:bifunctional lysylphosphatidylglycerol synthetase/lysine--tRNA ligase LysX [Microlunatus sagamiharensis]SDU82781.1 lysyl-tRNA synthetase, class II [Microlunatus sagamiharensis]